MVKSSEWYLSADKPGAATLDVPSSVIKGTAAELHCSVTDPGKLSCDSHCTSECA